MKRRTTPRSLVVRSTWMSSKKPESQRACTSPVRFSTLKRWPGFSRRYDWTSSRATRRLPTMSIDAMGRPSACSATVGGRRTPDSWRWCGDRGAAPPRPGPRRRGRPPHRPPRRPPPSGGEPASPSAAQAVREQRAAREHRGQDGEQASGSHRGRVGGCACAKRRSLVAHAAVQVNLASDGIFVPPPETAPRPKAHGHDHHGHGHRARGPRRGR